MRRFLTLVCLLCLAIPAGISVTGCTRNPAASYCNGAGYGMKITDVATITLQPATTGISIAYGQTRQASQPSAVTCKGVAASISGYTWGTSNNQLVDISPGGNICAGTWNRNLGGGIADYTICSPPNPMPSTGGLPYGTGYITASAHTVSSNPVEVYVHPQVTSVSLVTTPLSGSAQQCFSQNSQATLDAQACYGGTNNTQTELCAPASVTSANFVCGPPTHVVNGNVVPITPDIIASGSFTAPPVFTGAITGAEFVSGGSIAGTEGQTCNLTDFNNGSNGATATVALTGASTIASGTPLFITAGGAGATSAPTTAVLSNGTATCSGTATVVTGPIIGTAGETCTLHDFNNGSSGAAATVALTGANTIASGTPLVITAGGVNATSAPTAATLSNGTATCSGTVAVAAAMTPVPNCTAAIGTLSYTVSNSNIASINTNTTTNQVTITANQPGTTAITASVALSGSSAGYFSTCPPASISLTLANGETSGTISQGTTQNLVTTVTDTQGNPITGLLLDYQSTDPNDILVSAGTITTAFPGVASVFAICQPSICNPSPINEVGEFGTGLSVSSNPVKITTPGTASDYVWFSAPGQSQYFSSIELLTGAAGSTVRLPYVPNSMMMDRLGNNLYFGSPHELMIVSTQSNAVTTQNASVPGVVLAVSPNNAQVLINDQEQKLFYLYSAAGNSWSTFGGMGNAAAWTPDSKTLYITDNAALNNPTAGITGHSDTLYVYNQNNWTTYKLKPSPLSSSLPPGILPTTADQTITEPLPPNVAISSTVQTPAITIPSVGAYLRGSPTEAHTWCPSGTVGDYASMENSFYPLGDTVLDAANDPVQTDALAATTDGQHILGAAVTGSGVTLSDIGVSIPAFNCLPPATSPDYPLVNGDTLSPLLLSDTVITKPVNVQATAINQVVASPESNLAFITYTADATNKNASLPYYVPGSAAVEYISLTGNSTIIAPLAGVFTPDDKLFFVSTAGDNLIHYIDVPTLTDIQQISPNLPACKPVSAGGNDAGCTFTQPSTSPPVTIVPATAIAVKPRSTT